MSIELEDLHAIVGSVWESYLDRPIFPAAEGGRYERAGSVDIMGLWHGTVMLEMDMDTLRRAASSMFEVASEAVTQGQMNDALAELTNMVGGNIKCLLDQQTKLALPTVQTVDLETPLGEVEQTAYLSDGEGSVRLRLVRIS